MGQDAIDPALYDSFIADWVEHSGLLRTFAQTRLKHGSANYKQLMNYADMALRVAESMEAAKRSRDHGQKRSALGWGRLVGKGVYAFGLAAATAYGADRASDAIERSVELPAVFQQADELSASCEELLIRLDAVRRVEPVEFSVSGGDSLTATATGTGHPAGVSSEPASQGAADIGLDISLAAEGVAPPTPTEVNGSTAVANVRAGVASIGTTPSSGLDVPLDSTRGSAPEIPQPAAWYDTKDIAAAPPSDNPWPTGARSPA
ncbi:MAG: hypothetical protein ACFCVK_18170 [Acidimicrobiales bacterium]